jgi:hypothetical protein
VKAMRKLVAVILACGALGVASAEERNPLEAKFIVDAGWFFMSTDTRVRLDGETSDQIGTDVDFDETFGLGDFDRFRAEGLWRFTDSGRHILKAMYFENNREKTRSNTRDITFGDETFPVGASVTARSELAIIQLSYEYAFLQATNYELAGGIGVHYVDMGLSLSATLSAGAGGASREAREEGSTGAPLPVLDLRWLWRLSNNFYVNAQLQFFYIEFDPYSGGLGDVKASIVWQPTDHFGVGVGYNSFRFNFGIDDADRFDGRLRWDYGGGLVFASFMF